jgi:glutathione S-transferase
MISHYTNDLCPFAHRAMFARALCPTYAETIQMPYARQIEFSQRWGNTWPNTALGKDMLRKGNKAFGRLTAEALEEIKNQYITNFNKSGEVPTLQLASGTVLTESEIVMEYFACAGASLIPADPEYVCRMRLAIKRFNDVTGPLFALLKNQDQAKDANIEAIIQKNIARFTSTIDPQGFCIGDECTLADVHCCPILYRLDLGLSYWRHFSLRSNPRIANLLDTVTTMPEFQLGLVSDEEIIANYEFPAHALIWHADGAGFGGRGRSLSKTAARL